jgi:hypothetical protein
MPLLITEMQLDSAEFLSLVDKGASGDEDSRPSIVLFKRKKGGNMSAEKTLEAIKRFLGIAKQDNEPAEADKMENPQAKLEALGLSPKQMAAVLEFLAVAAKPAEPAAETPAAPMEMQEGNGEDEEEMAKRDLEIKKRDEEIAELRKSVQSLKDDAETVRLEKRADELKWLPMSKAETVELLKKAGDDQKVVAMLEKLNEASRKSPTLEVLGDAGPGAEARERLEKRAREILANDSTLTLAVAKRRAMAEDPDLYNQALEAQG